MATLDSGYVVTGIIEMGPGYGFLMKLDSVGDTLWVKSYNHFGNLWGMDVIQTKDSGFLTVYIVSLGGASDICVIKSNSSGDTLWTKLYSGPGTEFIWKAEETFDGGYILVGYTNSFSLGISDMYLIKTSSFGDTIWTKKIGGIGRDEAGAVIQTPDSNFLVCGNIDTCLCLIKFDLNGDTIWTKCFSGITARNMKRTFDGGYVLYAGLNLSKFDSQCDFLWARKYEAPNFINGSFDVLPTNKFIMTGFGMDGGNQIDYNILADSTGDTVWCRTFLPSPSGSYSVATTYDNGFVISGYWILKIDSNGHSYCHESALPIIISTPSAIRQYPSINIGPTSTIISQPQLQLVSNGTIEIECSSLSSESDGLNKANQISIYPNPARNTIYIKSSTKISFVEIMSVVGQKIYSSSTDLSESVSLNCEPFPRGIYFLRTETGQGTITTKFIKE